MFCVYICIICKRYEKPLAMEELGPNFVNSKSSYIRKWNLYQPPDQKWCNRNTNCTQRANGKYNLIMV